MSHERFTSVWEALEASPAQAENLKLRSALMISLKQILQREGLTERQAAEHLGITQPRVSNLMRGKISLFSLDSLVNMLAAFNRWVEIRIVEASPAMHNTRPPFTASAPPLESPQS